MATRLRQVLGWVVPIAAIAVILVGLWPRATPVAPEVRAQRLASIIACPWCDGQSVAESGADVSRDIRIMISDQIAAGMTDDQILTFFSDRYGPQIILDPPTKGWGLVLWSFPVLALGTGTALILTRRRTTALANRSQHHA